MQLSREEEAGAVLQGLRLLVHGLRVTSHSVERDHGLSGAQLFVLRELSTEPGISVRSLSERTMTDPSSVSVVVARLVERGLVSRDQDQADRRCNVLCVTASGRRLLKRAP